MKIEKIDKVIRGTKMFLTINYENLDFPKIKSNKIKIHIFQNSALGQNLSIINSQNVTL